MKANISNYASDWWPVGHGEESIKRIRGGLSVKALAAVMLFGVFVYACLFTTVLANDEVTPLVPSSDTPISNSPDSLSSDLTIEQTPESKIDLAGQNADAFIETQTVTQIRSAEILGESVVDVAGGAVGYVDDLIFDSAFQLHGVVISTGGFLGIGARSIALPWSAIEFSNSENPDLPSLLQINMSRDQLETAPEYLTKRDVKRHQQLLAQQNQRVSEQTEDALNFGNERPANNASQSLNN